MKNGKRRSWTTDDVRTLKTLARKRTTAGKIAKKLKRTEGATRQKAFSLGVSLDARLSSCINCAKMIKEEPLSRLLFLFDLVELRQTNFCLADMSRSEIIDANVKSYRWMTKGIRTRATGVYRSLANE